MCVSDWRVPVAVISALVSVFGDLGTQVPVNVAETAAAQKEVPAGTDDYHLSPNVEPLQMPRSTAELLNGWIKVDSIIVGGYAKPVATQVVASVLAPVAAATLAPVPTTVHFPAKGSRGMWVWTTEDILSDTSKTNMFIEEVRRSGVTQVYLYLTAAQVQKVHTQLRSLISTLRKTNILVFGMEGWRGYFSDASGPAGLYEAVNALARYNANVNSGERFVGFMSDMEPQDGQGAGASLFHNGIKESALTSIQLADRDRLLTDWLTILQHVHDRAHAAGLRIAASLPSWTDNYYGEPVLANWRNRREDVTHFLMGLVDDYCIMSYNTNPSNIANQILSKLKYANTLPRPPRVFGAVETHSGVGSGVSYGDTAGKNTRAAVISDLDAVISILNGGNPTFAGMNLHDWEGWRDLPTVSRDSTTPYVDTKRQSVARKPGAIRRRCQEHLLYDRAGDNLTSALPLEWGKFTNEGYSPDCAPTIGIDTAFSLALTHA